MADEEGAVKSADIRLPIFYEVRFDPFVPLAARARHVTPNKRKLHPKTMQPGSSHTIPIKYCDSVFEICAFDFTRTGIGIWAPPSSP